MLRTIRRLNTLLRGQFRPPNLHPQTQNLSILLGETIDPAISGSLGIDLLHLIYSDECWLLLIGKLKYAPGSEIAASPADKTRAGKINSYRDRNKNQLTSE